MFDYILLVPSIDKRSPNNVARNIANGVSSCGHKVDVLYIKNNLNDNFLDHRVRKFSISLMNILTRGDNNKIIHSHGFLPDFVSCLMKLILPRKNVKYISTLHSNIEIDLIESRGKLIGKVFSYLWFLFLKNKDEVICLNSSAKFDLLNRGIGLNKISIIRNGISCDSINTIECDEVDSSEDRNKVNIVSWSVVRKMKGHQYIIEMLKYNDDFHFILAGDGPFLNDLLQKANMINVRERCSFLGHCTDLEQVKKTGDVFVMCSEFEGVPMALFEALVAGLPCVCNKIPQLEELFSSNEVVFCNVYEHKELESAIRYALDNKQMLVANAQQKIIGCYSIEYMNDQYIEKFRNV